MNAEYSFIEYSYNPDVTEDRQVEDRLSDLGFTKRSQSRDRNISMWTQRLCIVILRATHTVHSEGITGLGLSANYNDILKCGASFDSETGCHLKTVAGGFRILFLDRSKLDDNPLSAQEVKLSLEDYRTTGIETFSGIVLQSTDRMLMDFLQDIGFKFTKSSDKYNTLVCANNRFSILIDKSANTSSVKTLICDTHDVFDSTAQMVANSVPLRKFCHNNTALNFGELNYKIVGYNCTAFGSEESYSIENMIDNAYTNVDVIFRQRKKHLDISEKSLDYYYENADREA